MKRLLPMILMMYFIGVSVTLCGQDLKDAFAERQVTSDDSGHVAGDNSLATVEPFEPRHAGKPGGHSLWIAWVPDSDGIVTIDTSGSSFDTLLAVYTLGQGTNNPMQLLLPVVSNDDDGATNTSRVQFGAIGGTEYEIAVDGYQGATGMVALNWRSVPSSETPPFAIVLPPDRSIQAGETLVLAPTFQGASPVGLQWFMDEQEVPGATSATLVVPNFQDVNVGRYVLRFSVDGDSFETQPIEVQINSEGAVNVLARDKFQDASSSGLDGPDSVPRVAGYAVDTGLGPKDLTIGVVRGYSGTQIFNTAYATVDPSEPQHCNLPTGASYWFAYDPPTNGTANLNTDGSNFDTVLAVYTYTPPLVSYQGLIPVTCDNNSGSNGITSQVQFSADPLQKYLIVVDGLNGARGIAYLNYALKVPAPTNQFTLAVTRDPASRTVAAGSTVTFGVLAQASSAVNYSWCKDSNSLPDQTNSSLTLTNVKPVDAGGYSVVLSTSFGSVTSGVATLTVLLPPTITTHPLPQSLLAGQTALFSVAAEGTPPLHFTWNKNGVPITNVDASTLAVSNVTTTSSGSYSVQILNGGGSATSAPAALAVLGRPFSTLDQTSGLMTVKVPVGGTIGFVVESAEQLGASLWEPWPFTLVTNGGLVSIVADPRTNAARFFRVRLQ